MSEDSVLGLIVGKLEKVIQILNRNGLNITTGVFGAEVDIGSRSRVPEIVEVRVKAGIYSSIGEVIDSVYQG